MRITLPHTYPSRHFPVPNISVAPGTSFTRGSPAIGTDVGSGKQIARARPGRSSTCFRCYHHLHHRRCIMPLRQSAQTSAGKRLSAKIDADTTADFLVGLDDAAQPLAEAILVELFTGLGVPQTAAVR